MNSRPLRSIWTAGAHALLIALAGCRTGEGQNRLSEPSSSASSAKRGGVFLSDVTLTRQDGGSTEHNLRLKEAWLEEVIERFEAIPLRRKVVGTRLCIRVAEVTEPPTLAGVNARLQIDGSQKLAAVPDATVYTANEFIISFKVDAQHTFPKKGMIVIEDPKTHESIVSIAFSMHD